MTWYATLGALCAADQPHVITTFGDANAELQAYQQGCTITPLSHFGLIRFQGEETQPFLQGQLSSDIRALPAGGIQYSSYSTPKGRMQATFMVIRHGDEYLLQLDQAILPALQKRLSMFILRSKTKASTAEELGQIGVAGPHAQAILSGLFGTLPATFSSAMHGDVQLIALENQRYQLLAPASALPALWEQLRAAGATPAGTAVWTLSEIQAGVPWVTAATQEEFVPQMANLELIGGISFTKGCYPGQEIVARTQYLGKLKRRMFRMQVDCDSATAGMDVFSSEMNGQASGKILLAAPSPTGGMEVLVVAQIASLEHGLHLGAVDGPALHNLPLPYAMN
ncbi:folate-binding protein YgfZ [Chitinibacter tainanensis]|uniref:CAF17-like 4Fe-4S cluster assembly/insertion protein YgfZ n=1 Tax=Chitinibacter tainanensis TaxID=230667 RepID=UPI002352747E|nr:folate-binding protein YgfZ [Chitinibacter tainanensis]